MRPQLFQIELLGNGSSGFLLELSFAAVNRQQRAGPFESNRTLTFDPSATGTVQDQV